MKGSAVRIRSSASSNFLHIERAGARLDGKRDGCSERLHYWVFGGPWTYEGERRSPADVDNAYLEEVFSFGGAMICGRTMYDVVNGWGADPGFGMPVFVVTHRPHERVVKGDTSFEFVTPAVSTRRSLGHRQQPPEAT